VSLPASQEIIDRYSNRDDADGELDTSFHGESGSSCDVEIDGACGGVNTPNPGSG